ncbi:MULTISPECIES: RidA family protein [unclassified Diaminobutyricimonas]|uniref:RidA family protein n=1 Tax=unclassified Diaminobutyricimonas TaxID=2643261 RepID=UPI0012F4954E|nr:MULTISPECIES: RidA family protein [unclassified Diaminobutyricimonas]
MPRTVMNPESVHSAPGYSHIAVAEGEKLVFFAGQVSLDDDLNIVGEDDLRLQVITAMSNLAKVMEAAGASWDDIVRRTVYTTQPFELAAIGESIAQVTGDAADPPQTIVGVTGLALPGLLVEIECTASLRSSTL